MLIGLKHSDAWGRQDLERLKVAAYFPPTLRMICFKAFVNQFSQSMRSLLFRINSLLSPIFGCDIGFVCSFLRALVSLHYSIRLFCPLQPQSQSHQRSRINKIWSHWDDNFGEDYERQKNDDSSCDRQFDLIIISGIRNPHQEEEEASSREHSLTSYGGSIIVRLTSCLTGLDLAKQVNLFLIKHSQSSWIKTNQNRRSAIQWYFSLLSATSLVCDCLGHIFNARRWYLENIFEDQINFKLMKVVWKQNGNV